VGEVVGHTSLQGEVEGAGVEDMMEEGEGQASEDYPSLVNNICVEYISVYISSSTAANMLLPQRT